MRELISMIMVLALMITLSSSVFAGTSTTSCVSKASELSAKSSSAYGNTNCSAWRGGSDDSSSKALYYQVYPECTEVDSK